MQQNTVFLVFFFLKMYLHILEQARPSKKPGKKGLNSKVIHKQTMGYEFYICGEKIC